MCVVRGTLCPGPERSPAWECVQTRLCSVLHVCAGVRRPSGAWRLLASVWALSRRRAAALGQCGSRWHQGLMADASVSLPLRAAGCGPAPTCSRDGAGGRGAEATPAAGPVLRFSPVQSCPSLQGGQRGWVRPGGRPAASGTGGLGAREGPHEGSSSSQRVSPSLRRPLKPHRSGAFLPHWVPGSAQRQIGVSRLDLVFRVDQLPGSGSAEPPNILDSKAAVAAGSARGRWQSRGPCSFSPAAPSWGRHVVCRLLGRLWAEFRLRLGVSCLVCCRCACSTQDGAPSPQAPAAGGSQLALAVAHALGVLAGTGQDSTADTDPLQQSKCG